MAIGINRDRFVFRSFFGLMSEPEVKEKKNSQLVELQNFPRKFTMTSNWISLHNRLSLENMDGDEIGSYHKEIFSMSHVYHLNDSKGHTMAKAKLSHLALGVDYSIHSKVLDDKYHVRLDKIDSALSLGDIYKISKNDVDVAECQKAELLHEYITVTEKGVKSATMKKSLMGLHTYWKISAKESATVPSWVIGFLAAIVQIEESIIKKKRKEEEEEKEEKEKKEKKKTGESHEANDVLPGTTPSSTH